MVRLRNIFFVTFLLFAGFIFVGARPLFSTSPKGQILVKFKESGVVGDRKAFHESVGAKFKQTIKGIDVDVVEISEGDTDKVLAKYRQNSQIEYAEPDYKASVLEETNDPYLSTKQWGMYKVQAASVIDSAWNHSKSNSGIKVAILDTGIDKSHPDLLDKVVDEHKCADSSTTLDDLYGHGTHVAGIVGAATNNGLGVAGIGYNTSLVNAKSLGDDGSGYYSWIATCIVWATQNGANVINMSLGAPYKSTTLENAVNYAWNHNVVLVAAAGNSGNASPTYPAYYKNVIAVAATDSNDVKPSWSSYGKWVSVAAPGVNIFSTFPTHPFTLGTQNGRSQYYDYASGTSMATPHVAGLAALIWASPYSADKTQVRRQIEGTADKIAGTGNYWKYGRINALRAVTQEVLATLSAKGR